MTHHHTTENVVGLDYQILLEADYLVNASESHFTREHIEAFRRDVMKTDTGKALLDTIYLR
ncbi:MAG: hypothetical protein MJ175_11785 [Clostridia bacterium]|nr:hypothetical protein [Clostridia bacterium]